MSEKVEENMSLSGSGDLIRMRENWAATQFATGKQIVCYVTLSAQTRDLSLHVFEILKSCFVDDYKNKEREFEIAGSISSRINALVTGTMVHGSSSRVENEAGYTVPTYRFHVQYQTPTISESLTFMTIASVLKEKYLK